MYAHLSRAVTRSPDLLESLQQLLVDVPWVWVGDCMFAPAQLVAFRAPANVTPYLFAVRI